MKYIVRTNDEKQNMVDYWVIDIGEDSEALALASRDGRTRQAHSWMISPVDHEFNPNEGGWKQR